MSILQQTDDDDEERIRKLLLWAKSRHIWIHEDAHVGKMETREGVEQLNSSSAQQSQPPDSQQEDGLSGSISDEEEEEHEQRAKGAGFGVYVKGSKLILERQVVVLVPKSTMLSARTSSLAPHLPPHMVFSSDATSGLLLTLVLMHEFLLGNKGPWWGYLQSLPRSEGQWGLPLPLSIDKTSSDWRWMDKTEVGRMVQRAESDPMGRIEGLGMSAPRLRSFFKHKGLAILKKAHTELDESSYSVLLPDFIRLYSIISSRTFIVDMYHGMCLVPIADMFNHSEYSNMHFEADDEVCDECGSLGTCPHNEDPLPSAAYGRPSAFLPAESGPNSADWTPPDELKDIDTVDMVAQSTIRGQEEAYNTYGNFSNANLLTTYGFCLDYDTEWDRYAWEWRHKEEREELLLALGFSSPSSLTSSRPREEEEEGGDEHNGEKADAGSKFAWVKTCMQFTGLPLDTFGELLDDVFMARPPTTSLTISKGQSKESTLVSLPVSSPFVALTKPMWEEDEDDNDHKEIEAESVESQEKEPKGYSDFAVEEVLSHFLVDISTHDGSKDKYQPLFVDGQGRVSVALWRSFLLSLICSAADLPNLSSSSQYVSSSSAENGNEHQQGDISQIVRKVEKRLAIAILHVTKREDGHTFDSHTTSTSDTFWRILHSSLQALSRLVQIRLSDLQTLRSQSVGGESNLSDLAIREWEPSIQRSAAIQASQELAALSSCKMLMTKYTQATAAITGLQAGIT